jgi:FkbM family methyltransferase
MIDHTVSTIYGSQAIDKLRKVRLLRTIWPLLRRVSYALMAPDTRLWLNVQSGIASGLSLYLNPRYEANIWHGTAEPAVQETLLQYLQSGMVFYDVGSHLGFFSMAAAQIVGPTGKVFAFEANPEIARLVRLNRDKNNLPQIYVIQRAVYNTNNGVSFGRALHHTTGGTSSIALAASNQGDDVISVPSIRLDDFARINPPPDIIKMDIEGVEIEALQGARYLFSTARLVLICEVHNQQARSFIEHFMQQHNYCMQWKDSQHVVALPSEQV